MLGTHTQYFERPVDDVWVALMDVLETKGRKVTSTDNFIKRLEFKTPSSWTSWGLNSSVTLTPKDTGTILEFTGSSRMGGLGAGIGNANDARKCRHEFDELIPLMSKALHHDHAWSQPLPSGKIAGRFYEECTECQYARYISRQGEPN